MSVRSNRGAVVRRSLPPMAKGLVKVFHGTINRGVRRIEWEMVDDIARGRGSGSDLSAFWYTAAFGYFLLIPVGLLVAFALGRAIPAVIPGAVLALPFVGGRVFDGRPSDSSRQRTSICSGGPVLASRCSNHRVVDPRRRCSGVEPL
jgi:hypothetical protein